MYDVFYKARIVFGGGAIRLGKQILEINQEHVTQGTLKAGLSETEVQQNMFSGDALENNP